MRLTRTGGKPMHQHSRRSWYGGVVWGQAILHLYLFIGVLGMLASAACAQNPVSGRPELVLISEEQEMKLGREQAEIVEEQTGLLDNDRFTPYLKELGERLVAESPRKDIRYRFHVVDKVEPNAFALPGGYVYVTRGMLPLMNSEDELAGLVGHEISHVAARHIVNKSL